LKLSAHTHSSRHRYDGTEKKKKLKKKFWKIKNHKQIVSKDISYLRKYNSIFENVTVRNVYTT
jgi:hypothetical protein